MIIPEINAHSLYNLACPNSSLIPQSNPLESQFKLCFQQYLLGLNIAPFLNHEFALCQGMNQLQEIAPELFKYPHLIQPGFTLNSAWQNYYLSSQFDALLIEDGLIHLFDCIMPPHDFAFIQLKQQLDCFLMIETSSYLPEELTYSTCLIGEEQPLIITSHYNQKQHQIFQEKLLTWLQEEFQVIKLLNNWQNGDSLTAQFLRKEISVQDYLDAIPEVAI